MSLFRPFNFHGQLPMVSLSPARRFMTFLAWDERLSVGEPSIDARHKVLVEALNELNTAVMQGGERNRVGTLLRSLVAYIRNHWAAEGRAMARIEYPHLEKQKGLHRQLLQTVQSQLD